MGLALLGVGMRVGDRRQHVVGGVPSRGVVFIDPRGHGPAGLLAGVGKCRWRSSSHSRVELNASATALSSADPVRPIDWVTPVQRHAAARSAFAALVGVEDHPVDAAAPHGDGHADCQLALINGDFGEIADPVGIRFRRRREVPLEQIRGPSADLSGRVVPRRLRLRRAIRPCSAISFATVLGDTFQPASRRIGGDPGRSVGPVMGP